jgi:NADPH-dependent ferric siderophore reductase
MLRGLLTARTYTPIQWDAERGHTRILAWSHGRGPGSDWARALASGDAFELFGPRRSLEIERSDRPLVLFGDETSFGLALALVAIPASSAIHGLFEVSSIPECVPVAAELALSADLVERAPNDAHLAEIEKHLIGFIELDADFVLTGRAPAVQRIHRTLKSFGVAPAKIRTKAYWAPGKTGLD